MQTVDLYGLRRAIIGAFTEDTLRMALDDELGKSLRNLVAPGNFEIVVFNLLKLAQREDWLERLLNALIRQNSARNNKNYAVE